MNAGATLFFIMALVTFLLALAYISLAQSLTPPPDTPSSGQPIPSTSYIGQGKCPVLCSCFPKPQTDGTITIPKTACAYLEDGEMFACPQNCCTPSCF